MAEDRALPQLNLPTRSAVLELWRDGQRPFTMRLEGNSMDPVAVWGDRVTIRPVSAKEPLAGDILAMHLGDAVVVHRFLVARTAGDGRRWYCQKGDNSPAWSWVLPETVLGLVVAIQGPDHAIQLQHRPWTKANRLAGRLGRVGVLLAGGRLPPHAGTLGSLAHRLNRGLATSLIRLALRRRR